MLLLIISGAVIVLGGLSLLIFRDYLPGIIHSLIWATVMFAIAVLLALLTAFVIFDAKKETDYQKALYKKSVLEYRLENPNLPGNELLYNEIVEFNNDLRNAKAYTTSKWIGIYVNEKIATIDYVTINFGE